MADVKRPILLQIGSSQEELCKPSRRKCPNSADRGSVCSESAGSSSNSSASSSLGSEIDSPSLILPYLYVGDQAQTQIDTISSLNISYILSLQSLPKFLSSSPQTTAPPTPDTELSPSSSTLNRNETLKPLKQQASVLVDVVAKESKLNECPLKETEFSGQPAQELAKYDIIDGADGGLLPSVNSSKDYLVKIKHLTDKNKTKLVDDSILKANDRDVAFDELDHAPMDAKYDDLPSSSGQMTRTLLLNNSRRSELEGRIICGDDITIGQRSAGLDRESSQRTSDSLPIDDDSAERDSNGVGGAETDPEASTSTSLAVPDYTTTEQSGCSLKQRCNRLSSSVHRLIRGKCINISDTFEQLLDKFFDETHSFIEEARRNKCNVLVHCKAGISRSPTIAIAYLMKWKRLHLQEAYNFVKRCRPQISPNLNFMGQLVSYERQLQRDRSQLPSPTSCCLPTLAMSSSVSQANHPSPIESPPSRPTSSREKPHSRTKDAQKERRVHNVHRRANQSNSIDTQNHDSKNKRAKLRSFFGRGRHEHHYQ